MKIAFRTLALITLFITGATLGGCQKNPLRAGLSTDGHPSSPESLKSMNTQFLKAVQRGDLQGVEEFLKRGVDINFKWRNEDREVTAIIVAVYQHNLPMVQLLLNQGASISTDYQGLTPIEIAMSLGDSDIERILRYANKRGQR